MVHLIDMFDLIGSHLFTARVEMFLLEMKVEGFFFTTDNDGRKAKSKCKLIKWDVQVGALTLYIL